jgi:PmbA protein
MVKDIKEGLIVEQLMGAEQTNVLGGEFSGNALLGFKVEKGEVTGRVKDTVVSGNIYQILNKSIVLGREAKWVGGAISTPAIYCSHLTIASKG